MEKRELIARRIAQELKDGYYVNLGIGIPTLVANYIPPGIYVQRIIKGPKFEKPIEQRTVRKRSA